MYLKYLNICVIFCLLIVPFSQSRSYRYAGYSNDDGILKTQKRVSDQRLAELETLLAISEMGGKLMKVPVGFGKLDPERLGRRRRSVEMLLQELLENQEDDRAREDEESPIWIPEMI